MLQEFYTLYYITKKGIMKHRKFMEAGKTGVQLEKQARNWVANKGVKFHHGNMGGKFIK